jgi:hypothetical protein
MWEPILPAGLEARIGACGDLTEQKKGAETAPEDVPKEEDENRERVLPASSYE